MKVLVMLCGLVVAAGFSGCVGQIEVGTDSGGGARPDAAGAADEVDWVDAGSDVDPGTDGSGEPEAGTDGGGEMDPGTAALIGPRPVDPTDLSRGTLFASPGGSGSACSAADPCDAWTVIGRAGPGDVVFFRGGVYALDRDLNFDRTGTPAAPIRYESYPGKRAIFDGSTLTPLGAEIKVNASGGWQVLRLLEVRHMPRRGMGVGGSHNVLEGIEVHHNLLWGLQVFGTDNVVRDCIAHDNSDVGYGGGYDGGMSDGITILGENILVSHCLSFGNSDDGIDSWEAINPRVEYSITYGNGLGGGDGHGFKMGGPPPSTGSVVEHSIAFNNRAFGFNWNGGGPVTARYVTSVGNGGYGFYADSASSVENCIAADNGMAPASGGAQANNSWQRGGTVGFESTDPSSPSFLRPTPGGGFEDIGAYAGLGGGDNLATCATLPMVKPGVTICRDQPDRCTVSIPPGSSCSATCAALGQECLRAYPEAGACFPGVHLDPVGCDATLGAATFCQCGQPQANPTRQQVVTIGDSTMASPDSYPIVWGWGDALPERGAHPEDIHNLGQSGSSSLDFTSRSTWPVVLQLLGPGVYLFIQFGHNDWPSDPGRHTEPGGYPDYQGSYRERLLFYASTARAAGAIPVLLTSVGTNTWAGDGVTTTCPFEDYLAAARKLAKDEGLPLLDANRASRADYERLGEAQTRAMYSYDESTHFSPTGARRMAELAVRLGCVESEAFCAQFTLP